jgi:hypothetical protein
MTDFRLCSTCQSRSQAGLCHYTPQLMSDQLEPTIARLRYSLGGDRPSQTTHHTGSRTRFHWPRLDNKIKKGGISLVDSTKAGALASKSSAYATHLDSDATVKL